jgi:hypothetical protein
MGSQFTLEEIFDSLNQQDMTTLGYRLVEYFYSLDRRRDSAGHRRLVLRQFRKSCMVQILEEAYDSFLVRVTTIIYYKKKRISTTMKQREEQFWVPQTLFWKMMNAPSILDSDISG